MKKLVCLGAFVAVAVAANAATYKWTTKYEVADATPVGVTSATIAYFIDASVMSQSQVYEAYSGDLGKAIGENAIASAAMSSGKISATSGTLTGYSADDTLSAYMVLFDADLGALYFSEQMDRLVLSSDDTKFLFESNSSMDAVAEDMTGFSTASGGWVAVPEPTSGMLLLLGMAGLALKRKRA